MRLTWSRAGRQPDGTVYSEVTDVGELDESGRIKRLTTFDAIVPAPAGG